MEAVGTEQTLPKPQQHLIPCSTSGQDKHEVRQNTEVGGLVSSATVTVQRRLKPWQRQHCQSNEAHVGRAWGGISEDKRPEWLKEKTDCQG